MIFVVQQKILSSFYFLKIICSFLLFLYSVWLSSKSLAVDFRAPYVQLSLERV